MDQKMAWVQATPIRESISIAKLWAVAERIWQIPKRRIVPRRSFRKSSFDARSMRGRDMSMTTRA